MLHEAYTFVSCPRRYVFEMIPDYARNVISGFARLGGETVGIIANNPLVLAGVLDIDAAIKASR
jgi:propionyl-CoA carboxylase beta chain